MATYKLIQDIEAEDKILGPLTLRQFIFALITAFLLYINFVCLIKGVGFLLILFLPPALLTGFFAFPFGRDQPTEIWALGKLRFWFKPRRRIWDQSGIKELVTITVPKKIQHVYTDGLSQTEVKSRLKALANTIDSRGWVVKNVAVNAYRPSAVSSSDRLLDIDAAPPEVPDDTVLPSDDIMDEHNNPIAQQFNSLINRASQAHREQLVNEMQATGPAAAAAQWFMPSAASGDGAPAVASPAVSSKANEAALTTRLQAKANARPIAYGNLRTLRPSGSRAPTRPAPQKAPAPAATTPAIMALAHNNDLNVATLAREAQKAKEQAEVVISLH